MEGDVITLQDVFLFDFGMGIDEHGTLPGAPQGHGRPAEVHREAGRPGHPARPRGLPARGVRPTHDGGRLMRRALGAAQRAAGCSLLLVSGLLLPLATAQQPKRGLVHPRASTPRTAEAVSVTFSYVGRSLRPDRASSSARATRIVDGPRPRSRCPTRRASAIVLAIDASGSMSEGALIERVHRGGSRSSSRTRRPTIRSPSSRSTPRSASSRTSPPTTPCSSAAIDRSHWAQRPRCTTASCGPAALFDDTSLQPNLIVFSDGADTCLAARPLSGRRRRSRTPAPRCSPSACRTQASSVLEDMAAATGGTSAVASRPSGRRERSSTAVQATLRKQYVVTYASEPPGGAVPLDPVRGEPAGSGGVLRGQHRRRRGRAAPPGRREALGPSAPSLPAQPSGPVDRARSSSRWPSGWPLSASASASSAARTGSTARCSPTPRATSPTTSSTSTIEAMARPSSWPRPRCSSGRSPPPATSPSARGSSRKIEGQLERANLPLRPPEAIFFYFAGVVVVGAARGRADPQPPRGARRH